MTNKRKLGGTGCEKFVQNYEGRGLCGGFYIEHADSADCEGRAFGEDYDVCVSKDGYPVNTCWFFADVSDDWLQDRTDRDVKLDFGVRVSYIVYKCYPLVPASPPPLPPSPPTPAGPPSVPPPPPETACDGDVLVQGRWYSALEAWEKIVVMGPGGQALGDCASWCSATTLESCSVRAGLLFGYTIRCGFDAALSQCALFYAEDLSPLPPLLTVTTVPTVTTVTTVTVLAGAPSSTRRTSRSTR